MWHSKNKNKKIYISVTKLLFFILFYFYWKCKLFDLLLKVNKWFDPGIKPHSFKCLYIYIYIYIYRYIRERIYTSMVNIITREFVQSSFIRENVGLSSISFLAWKWLWYFRKKKYFPMFKGCKVGRGLKGK